MYRTLAKKLSNIFRQKHVTQKDIDAALLEIEKALIDADVALESINALKIHLMHKMSHLETIENLDIQSQLMNEVRQGLLELLESPTPPITIQPNKLHTIMFVGLQGAGKTTTCAKLANQLKTQGHHKILMCSTDTFRPAAMEQLKTLADSAQVDYFDANTRDAPESISAQAKAYAQNNQYQILIIDTAGRLEVDEARMNEAALIHKTVQPQECLYVIDSMIGQSALQVAKTFHKKLPLTGVILTKTDSDTKGGVALSVKQVTQKPILWLGSGEHIDQLEPFDPKQVVDQILDMGDIMTLAKRAEKHIDQDKAKQMTQRMQKGQFTFEDMLGMMDQMSALGGAKSILQMLPGSSQIPQHMLDMADDKKFIPIRALIESMTAKERNNPMLVFNQKTRQLRIKKGSGRTNSEFNELKKMYSKIEKMMSKMKKSRFKDQMANFMNPEN